MELIQTVATRARKIRFERGLTQAQFAEQAGISYKFYQQIEAGRKKHIRMDTVDRIAKGFGLEFWQFVVPEELLSAVAAVAEAQAPYPPKPLRKRKPKTKPKPKG